MGVVAGKNVECIAWHFAIGMHTHPYVQRLSQPWWLRHSWSSLFQS